MWTDEIVRIEQHTAAFQWQFKFTRGTNTASCRGNKQRSLMNLDGRWKRIRKVIFQPFSDLSTPLSPGNLLKMHFTIKFPRVSSHNRETKWRWIFFTIILSRKPSHTCGIKLFFVSSLSKELFIWPMRIRWRDCSEWEGEEHGNRRREWNKKNTKKKHNNGTLQRSMGLTFSLCRHVHTKEKTS